MAKTAKKWHGEMKINISTTYGINGMKISAAAKRISGEYRK